MNTSFIIDRSTNQLRNFVFGIGNMGTNDIQRDEINQLREKIIEDFTSNLYWKSVYKNLAETVSYDIWIYDGKIGEKKVKKFTSYPYPTVQFKSGDYISYTDDSGNYQVWMIIDLDQTNEWEVTGEIRQCVYELPWQNKAGDIIKRWCVIDTVSSGDGLQITDQIRTLDSTYKIKLPFDSETVLLREDKRFIIDDPRVETPHTYKVAEVNGITQNYGVNGNVLTLTVVKDEFRPTEDNKELMIAGYFSPTTPDPEPTVGYSTIYATNTNLIVGGNPRTLSVVFYDDVDTVNNSITARWVFNYNGLTFTSTNSYFKITPVVGTNNIKIQALENGVRLGETVTATVDDGNGGYESSIVLKCVSS